MLRIQYLDKDRFMQQVAASHGSVLLHLDNGETCDLKKDNAATELFQMMDAPSKGFDISVTDPADVTGFLRVNPLLAGGFLPSQLDLPLNFLGLQTVFRRNALDEVLEPFVDFLRPIGFVIVLDGFITLFDRFGSIPGTFFHPFGCLFRLPLQFVAFGLEVVNQSGNAGGQPLDQQHGPAQRPHRRFDGGSE